MRVLCRHGHFAFYPRTSTDIATFVNRYGQELVRAGEFYTFPLLVDAPDYSLQGKPYLNLPALSTFEGKPWDVMRENGFVYSIATGLLVPKLSVTVFINPPRTGMYLTAETPLIQPGSRNITGQQLLSYDAEFDPKTFILRVREFNYE